VCGTAEVGHGQRWDTVVGHGREARGDGYPRGVREGSCPTCPTSLTPPLSLKYSNPSLCNTPKKRPTYREVGQVGHGISRRIIFGNSGTTGGRADMSLVLLCQDVSVASPSASTRNSASLAHCVTANFRSLRSCAIDPLCHALGVCRKLCATVSTFSSSRGHFSTDEKCV